MKVDIDGRAKLATLYESGTLTDEKFTPAQKQLLAKGVLSNTYVWTIQKNISGVSDAADLGWITSMEFCFM